MIKTSYWKFSKTLNLDNAIELINSKLEKDISDQYKIVIKPIMNTTDDMSINKKSFKISETDIEYVFFRLSYIVKATGVIESDTDIVIYYDDILRMNVHRGRQNVKKYINNYFDEDKWGKIIDDMPGVSEDLLYWVFKSYIDNPRTALSNDNKLFLSSLKGYRGVTKDQNNSLRGDGDRISEILGTLAFLLNNDLKMLRPKVTYIVGDEKHNVLMDIRLTGTIMFEISDYKGFFNGKDEKEELPCILSILCSRHIIPKFISSYNYAIESKSWSSVLKRDFLKRIGEEIKTRVDIELEKLDKEIVGDNTQLEIVERVALDVDSELDEIELDEIELDEE